MRSNFITPSHPALSVKPTAPSAQPLAHTTRNASAPGRPSPLRTTRHRTHRIGRSSISRHSIESRYEKLWTAWRMSTHYSIPGNTQIQQDCHPCAPCNIHSFGRNPRNGHEDTTSWPNSDILRTRKQDPAAPRSCMANMVL